MSAGPIASSAAPAVWRYRTADGVDHYVGSAADVPAGQRTQPVDLSGVPLNRTAEKSLETSERRAAESIQAQSPGAAPHAARWLPGAPALTGAALFLAALAWLLHRLYRDRYSGNERLWRAARATTWLAGLSVVLVAVRLALPHLGRWRQQLAPFGFDALVAEEGRNSDIMHANIEKAERKSLGLDVPDAKRPPPRPFWSGAPPPAGLLHR
ncbi:MAG: hypothetical protein ACYDCL_16870 [Myxococcales bacterium]